MVWQMAIAAVAHVFIFSAEPYHYIPASEYGKVTTERTKEEVKLEGDTPAVLEKQDTKVEAPGTSVTESVQDIVLIGGQHVSSFPLEYAALLFGYMSVSQASSAGCQGCCVDHKPSNGSCGEGSDKDSRNLPPQIS